MNIYPGNIPARCPAHRQERNGFRMTAASVVMVFVFGIFTGYILGLWHQIGQKLQRIEDEKILAAGSRLETNTPSVGVDER